MCWREQGAGRTEGRERARVWWVVRAGCIEGREERARAGREQRRCVAEGRATAKVGAGDSSKAGAEAWGFIRNWKIELGSDERSG